MRNLKTERTRAGLTQKELAERAGVTIATISDLERGMREPHAITVKKLADALEIPVERLLEEAEEDRPLAVSGSGSR